MAVTEDRNDIPPATHGKDSDALFTCLQNLAAFDRSSEFI